MDEIALILLRFLRSYYCASTSFRYIYIYRKVWCRRASHKRMTIMMPHQARARACRRISCITASLILTPPVTERAHKAYMTGERHVIACRDAMAFYVVPSLMHLCLVCAWITDGYV